MTRISVELVPRDEQALRNELAAVSSEIKNIDVINIPDLLRYQVRSWEGAGLAREFGYNSMPHIRAIDIDLEKPLPMVSYLRENNIKEVLVVAGDPPQDMNHKIYPTESVDVIWKFRKEMPEVKVYAAIDQYRSNMRQEQYRIRRKLQAGAHGFFTQPFFDMRYLEMYAELLADVEVYWGVSPVTAERSASYWEMKNNVIFPKNFEPTLEWNIEFGKKVLSFAREKQDNIYLMPIKTNLLPYLLGILQA